MCLSQTNQRQGLATVIYLTNDQRNRTKNGYVTNDQSNRVIDQSNCQRSVVDRANDQFDRKKQAYDYRSILHNFTSEYDSFMVQTTFIMQPSNVFKNEMARDEPTPMISICTDTAIAILTL